MSGEKLSDFIHRTKTAKIGGKVRDVDRTGGGETRIRIV